jgi:alkylation response protein AidB-like acyl-CoA dehydrogenase
MALTLARPEHNPAGGKGLAMFYLELRDADGRLQRIRVERLKDKLGTRKVPTAELTLDGARAVLIGQPRNGTRAIEPMLGITRMWNSVCAGRVHARVVSRSRARMRRSARHSARSSSTCRAHVDTLAMLEAETWGAFLMAVPAGRAARSTRGRRDR